MGGVFPPPNFSVGLFSIFFSPKEKSERLGARWGKKTLLRIIFSLRMTEMLLKARLSGLKGTA